MYDNKTKEWTEYSGGCGGAGYSPEDTSGRNIITLSAGGGTGYMSEVLDESGTYTLPICAFLHPKYCGGFTAWSVNGTQYQPGDTITVSEDTVISAVWDFYLSADDNNKSVKLNVPTAGTYKVIFADYENGALANLDIVTKEVSQAEIGTVTVDMKKDFVLEAGDKVMLWNNINDMIPLCEAYEVKGYFSLAAGDNNKSVKLNVPTAGTYKVIFADYENGALANLDIVKKAVSQAEIGTVTVDMQKDFVLGTGDKVMLWDNIINMIPLCEAYEVK